MNCYFVSTVIKQSHVYVILAILHKAFMFSNREEQKTWYIVWSNTEEQNTCQFVWSNTEEQKHGSLY